MNCILKSSLYGLRQTIIKIGIDYKKNQNWFKEENN